MSYPVLGCEVVEPALAPEPQVEDYCLDYIYKIIYKRNHALYQLLHHNGQRDGQSFFVEGSGSDVYRPGFNCLKGNLHSIMALI